MNDTGNLKKWDLSRKTKNGETISIPKLSGELNGVMRYAESQEYQNGAFALKRESSTGAGSRLSNLLQEMVILQMYCAERGEFDTQITLIRLIRSYDRFI